MVKSRHAIKERRKKTLPQGVHHGKGGRNLGVTRDTIERGLEKSLRESEERLTKLLRAVERSGEIIFLTDPEGTITYANPAFTKAYGYGSDEVVGKTTPRILKSGMMKRKDYALFWKTILSKQIVKGELINKTKDGRMLNIEGSANPILDNKGNIIGFLGVQRDITERKRLEEKLKRSKELLENVVNTVPEGLDIVDEKLNILWMNDHLLKRFGKGSIGKKCYEVYKDDKRQCEKCLLKKNIEIGRTGTLIVPGVCNGRIFEISHTGMKYESGKAVLESFRDITNSKMAEAMLQESEKKYRTLYDSSSDAIMMLSPPNWRFTSGNPATLKMFGAKNEKEFTSKGPWELSPPRQPDGTPSSMKAKMMINKAMRAGSNFFEWTHRRINGKDFPATVLLTRMKAGDKCLLQATVRDVTQNKKDEMMLRQSEQKYRDLFESSRDAIMTLNPLTWKFTSGNASTIKLFRTKDEKEFTSLGPWNVSPKTQPNGQPSSVQAKKMIMTAMKNGSHFFEWEHMAVDGKPFPCTVLLTRMQGKDGPFLQATVRDVAEVKKREEALKESENKFRSLIDNSPDCIKLFDIVGNIVYMNPGGQKEHRIKRPEDAVGFDYMSSIEEKDRPKVRKAFARAKAGKPASIEVKHVEGTTTREYCSMSMTPVHGTNRKVIAIIDVSRDITEHKKIEEMGRNYALRLESEVNARTAQLQEEKQKVEALSAVKDEFIRNISHELKTPISVILGNLTLLKDMAPIGQEKEWMKMLDMLERNSERLRGSVDQILQINRIDTAELRKDRIYLKELIKDVQNEHLPLAEMKKLDIQLDVEPMIIIGDSALIRLAINNLISNAIKFTDRGSVSVIAKELGDDVRITVTDTGRGISPNDQKRLFEKFFKADPSAPGTGIGLAITKGIIERHGGRITFTSRLGKGSTFETVIPRNRV